MASFLSLALPVAALVSTKTDQAQGRMWSAEGEGWRGGDSGLETYELLDPIEDPFDAGLGFEPCPTELTVKPRLVFLLSVT